MGRENLRENLKGRGKGLPEELEHLVSLISRSMPVIDPPVAFQQSLRERLVLAGETVLAGPAEKGTSPVMRGVIFGAAATLSVAGAAFFLWRRHVFGEVPAVSALASRSGSFIRSEMAKAAR